MRGKVRRLRPLAMVAALAILAAGCSSGDGDESGEAARQAAGEASEAVFRIPITEPFSIDPYSVRESDGANVAKALFVGLVTYDGNPELAMSPGVATDWSASEGCTTWTFELRESEFSNGEPVTAESFIRGWTRTADAASASQVAYHLSGVAGYEELHGDPQTATTFSGLSAPDDSTLVVALSAPDCEFDRKTLAIPLSPVPSTAGPADDQEYNEAPIGNGPFMMEPGTAWDHNQGISLVRNESYFGDPAGIDGIEFLIFPVQGRLEAEYRAFTAGDADFARVPGALIEAARDAYEPRGGFLQVDTFGINYLLPNVAEGPMSDPDARRAVSLAIDRAAISEGVYQGSLTPATALVTPAFGAYYQDEVCDACEHDVGAAKERAEAGGLDPGTRLRLLYNVDGGHDTLVQALQGQLETTLGVVVELEGAPFTETLTMRDNGDFDLVASGWGVDYPTVESFLFPLLGSESADNDGRYENERVDSLLGDYRLSADVEQKIVLAQEIEEIAIGQDVALIPTFYRTQHRVFAADRFEGVELDFLENPTVATIRPAS